MQVSIASMSAQSAMTNRVEVANAVTAKVREMAEVQGQQMVSLIESAAAPAADARSGTVINTYA